MDKTIHYPTTDIKPITETLHGIKIIDNYIWLENINDLNVQAWIEAQNKFSDNFIRNIRGREKISRRLEELHQYDYIIEIRESEIGCFYKKKIKGEKQPILYFRPFNDLDSEQKIIDVNIIDPAGFTSLDYFYPSNDGKYLIYGQSKDGSELSTLYIFNMTTRKILQESIERARFSLVEWKNDNSGFYYTRFPFKDEVPEGEESFHSHVRFHKLHTNSKDDPLIFKPKVSHEYPYFYLSTDETFMIALSYRFVSMDVHLIDLSENKYKVTDIILNSKWMIYPSLNENFVYFLSNHEFSNFAVYRTSVDKISKENWIRIIEPEENEVFQEIKATDEGVVIRILENIANRIKVYDLNGKFKHSITIPKDGAISSIFDVGFSFRKSSKNIFFGFESFFDLPTMYSYNLEENILSIFHKDEVKMDRTKFSVKNIWYESKDGTKVHMFLLHHKDNKFSKVNPTLLYGYGGFGISITPTYSPYMIHWLEMNGIFVVANIRGGGELGEDWHKDGFLENKQNSFDDFIGAARYLIKEKYCDSSNLGIMGASNGGLLVGAVTVQEPQLFEAVYCGVPLLDMIRYHKFLLGKTWMPEYGNPEEEKDFEWIFSYSPYHNVKDKIDYPSIFFKTATTDTRVDPNHALKMTALMQKSSSSDKPIILKVETKAGHGIGKPQNKQIENQTDILSYFKWRLMSEPER